MSTIHRMLVVAGTIVTMTSVPAFGQTSPGPTSAGTPAPASWVRVWIGRSTLRMREFNDLLRSQQNNTLPSGFDVAAEVDAIPVPVPLLKAVAITIPAGALCINASSRTVHSASGASATVNWQLPVCGVYVSPRLAFRRGAAQINLRPIGIGYYPLGHAPMTAGLVISDRPGSLRAKSNAWGYIGMVGVEFPMSRTSLLVETGYRNLRFSDVTLTPQNGFTTGVAGLTALASSLPQSLDFSGVVFRVGIGLRLN